MYVDIGELIASLREAAPIEMAEECQAEEIQKKPQNGPATSLCSCLVLLRLDLLPYYSTGFE